MERFIYQEGELEILACQCEQCRYAQTDNANSCQYYQQKPEEVIQNNVKCTHFSGKIPAPWETDGQQNEEDGEW